MHTILQAAAGAQAAGGAGLSMWVMLLLFFIIMYFFMIRPQRNMQKEMEKFRQGLQKGDKVVTSGGIYGTVAEVDERTVLLKVDGDVKIRVDKGSLQRDPNASNA